MQTAYRGTLALGAPGRGRLGSERCSQQFLVLEGVATVRRAGWQVAGGDSPPGVAAVVRGATPEVAVYPADLWSHATMVEAAKTSGAGGCRGFCRYRVPCAAPALPGDAPVLQPAGTEPAARDLGATHVCGRTRATDPGRLVQRRAGPVTTAMARSPRAHRHHFVAGILRIVFFAENICFPRYIS